MKPLHKIFYYLLITILLSQCACDEAFEKKEELPPITQTGANTFGCLVNGDVWLPKGNDGTANLDLSYDPTFNYGTFDLRTYRYVSENQFQYIIIFSDSLSTTGTYPLEGLTHQVVTFSDGNLCYYSTNEIETVCNGTMSIGKFDLLNGIISGEFEFSIVTQDCDTVFVTAGRFDMRI